MRQPQTLFAIRKVLKQFYPGDPQGNLVRHLDTLAYLWIVCLGALAAERGWLPLIHRNRRCDWSLFRIGMADLLFEGR